MAPRNKKCYVYIGLDHPDRRYKLCDALGCGENPDSNQHHLKVRFREDAGEYIFPTNVLRLASTFMCSQLELPGFLEEKREEWLREEAAKGRQNRQQLHLFYKKQQKT